jgi:hypothetical protein
MFAPCHIYRIHYRNAYEKGLRDSILELRLQAELLVDRLRDEPDYASGLTWTEWAALFEVLVSRSPDRSDFRRLPDESLSIVLAAFREYGITADLSRFANLWADVVAFLWANETDEIAEAAEACLPVIQVCLQRAKDKKTLLRPGERGEESGELLRPASGAANEDSTQMLRSSSVTDKLL